MFSYLEYFTITIKDYYCSPNVFYLLFFSTNNTNLLLIAVLQSINYIISFLYNILCFNVFSICRVAMLVTPDDFKFDYKSGKDYIHLVLLVMAPTRLRPLTLHNNLFYHTNYFRNFITLSF